MKQLKFMLAAATAVGLAAAAQAAVNTVKTIDNENFEADSFVADTAATNYPGYSFAGENPADDESVITTNGYNSTKALQVNTGTDPLLRALDVSGSNARSINLAAVDSAYIDTMVQFTVTPAGDTVTVTGEDKLMIYLAEVTNETGVVTGTNLMVKAGRAVVDDVLGEITGVEPDDFAVTAEDLTVVPNEWYNLKVNAVNENGLAVFTIFINGKQLKAGISLGMAGDVDGLKFPSMQGLYDETSKPDALSLTYVGFAGEGMVDDITVAKLETVTTVDFTIAWNADGFSAVTYTINDGAPATPENGVAFKVNPGDDVKITLGIAEWYKRTDEESLNYVDVAANTSVEFVAEKTANVDSEGNVEITTDTTPADVYVSGGSFASVATAEDVAKLNKALTWAKKVAGKTTASAAGALVSELNFADGDETDAEQAYLLNCDPTDAEALKEAKDNFKFEAFNPETFDAENIAKWVQSVVEALNDKDYNGTVEIHGATTLENGGDWAKDKPGAFYKAVLTK